MTKEQKEAIKYFEENINYFKEQIKFIKAVDCDYYDEEYELYKNRVKQFETVLNMLKEKDAEIEKKDKMIDLLVNKLNQDCKVFENGEIKEIVEIYEKIKSTSDLRGIELRKECIKQYFESKAEKE